MAWFPRSPQPAEHPSKGFASWTQLRLTNCPNPSIVVQETTTDEHGAYRLSGLHNGELNFLWVSKEGYVAGGPVPAVSCDGCDWIVTVSGDTQLDLEVVRR